VSDVDLLRLLFPQLSAVQVETVRLVRGSVRIIAATTSAAACCSDCQTPSTRVHSRYVRRLGDASVGGREVLIDLRVRRFRCLAVTCGRRIFAEPLPGLADRYQRRTLLAGQVLSSVGMAVGGRGGSRLAERLAVATSRSTVIRIVRRVPDPPAVTPTVLGVDDFAIRRGHRYATILVDMHTHQPVDVLPDRTAETLATWLRTHPGVTMICRDRGGSYAEGANRALPGIPQIADRWHLLHNLSGHVQNAVARHRRCLQAAEQPPPVEPRSDRSAPPSLREANTTSRWQQVHQLTSTGNGIYQIANQLHLDPKTVRRYLAAHSPEDLLGPARTGRRSLLDAYKPYLHTRLDEDVTNTTTLLAEIAERGYRGSERTLRRWLVNARTVQHRPPTPPPVPSARTISSWIMRPTDKLDENDRAALKNACTQCPDIAAITDLAHGFTHLLRERHSDQLNDWIATAAASDYPDIRSFANGLRKDINAVTAGLSLPWSSGAVEGQVNRIKMLKRQMFGRAKFDLLRIRILART
jgi:transposase